MMLRRTAFVTLDGVLLAAIAAVAVWVVHSPWLLEHPDWMGVAVTIDLTLTAGLVHVLTGQLGARLPAWTTLTVVGAGALLAHVLLPDSAAVAVILGVLELAAFAGLGWMAWTLWRRNRAHRLAGASGWQALEGALGESVGSPLLASAAIMEARLLVLAFAGPFRRTPRDTNAIAMHRESGWMWVSVMLVGLSAIEVPALHLLVDWLVSPWSDYTAVAAIPWILSGLSVYGALWLFGDAQALRLHPTRVSGGVLHLAVGLRWQARIPLRDIRAAEPADEPGEADVSVFGSPNVRLDLHRPVELRGPFGIRRQTRSFTLQVDDVARFRDVISRG